MAPATASLRIVAGSGAGRTLRLQKLITVIGSAKAADLVIEGEKVAENHASIEAGADGSYVLRNRSPFGTLVNKTRIDVHPLADGERIQIGAAALVEFRAGAPVKVGGTTTSSKKVLFGVLGGAYLVGMALIAMLLQNISDDSSGGVAESDISASLDETRALFDPQRKDVDRPSAPVVIDDSDPTSPYFRVVNAQLRGEDPAAVQKLIDDFMSMLGTRLREASALERQERWEEADRQYRELMQFLPGTPSPVAILAAKRLQIVAQRLPSED